MSRSDRGDRALFALDAERPEGWFLATNLTPVGWFPATNLTAVGWFLAANIRLDIGSPRGELDAERPEGWFLATNLKDIRSGAMGWFPTQGLKINRTTAMYTQKNLFPNNLP